MYIDKIDEFTYLVIDLNGEAIHKASSYEAAEFWIEEFSDTHTPDRDHRPV